MKRGLGVRTFAFFAFTILVFSIFNFSFVLAQESTPEGETTKFAEEYTVNFDAGVGYNNAFISYFDHFAEDIQLAMTNDPAKEADLQSQFGAERLAEMKEAIENGDYESAKKLAEESKELFEAAAEDTANIDVSEVDNEGVSSGEDKQIYELISTQDEILQYGEYMDSLQKEMEENKVDEKIISEITDTVSAGTSEISEAVNDKTDETVENIADNSQLSPVEADIIVEKLEGESGLSKIYESKTTDEKILELSETIVGLQTKVTELKAEGNIDDARVLEALVDQAQLAVLESADAKKTGNYGEAYGRYTEAEHLTLNAERALDRNAEGDNGAIDKLSEIIKSPDEIRQEQERKSEHFASEEWKKMKDEIIAKYPEKELYFEKREEQAAKITELNEKLSDKLGEKYNELLADGKTEKEAAMEIGQAWDDAFAQTYGESYVPPGFMSFYPGRTLGNQI